MWAVGLFSVYAASSGWRCPAKKPKRRRRGVSTGLPTKATHRGHVWTWDFVHDMTVRGGKLRMLNVLDEHTRECLCLYVARRINARKVRLVYCPTWSTCTVRPSISAQIMVRNASRASCDSGWRSTRSRRWISIWAVPSGGGRTGPWSASTPGYVKSRLNRELLWTLTEARVVLGGLALEVQPRASAPFSGRHHAVWSSLSRRRSKRLQFQPVQLQSACGLLASQPGTALPSRTTHSPRQTNTGNGPVRVTRPGHLSTIDLLRTIILHQ